MSTSPAAQPGSTPPPLGERQGWARSLVRFDGHEGAHRVALRAAATLLVPFVVLLAIGHIEFSLFAAFGAFTAVYGRGAVYRARLRMQVAAATVLVASVLLGVLVASLPGSAAGREWTAVVVASVWAAAVTVVSDAFRWLPPGPLFAVFALCAVASVPVSPGEIIIAFSVSAGTAVFAVIVGQLGRARRAVRPGDRMRQVGSDALPALVRPTRSRLLYASRFTLAAAIAGSLSTALGIGHPYWAMVAAIVPLVAIDLPNAFARGTQRVIGTVLGLGLAFLLLSLNPTGLVAVLVVVALQGLAELLVLRNYGVALLFVTPLALVMIDLAHPTDTVTLIADRAVETLLGTAVALLVAVATTGLSGFGHRKMDESR